MFANFWKNSICPKLLWAFAGLVLFILAGCAAQPLNRTSLD